MNPKPDTFVILSPGFPKDEGDSACLPAQQLFVRLLKEQFPYLDVTIIAFQYPFQKSSYQWKGVKVLALAGQNKRKISRWILWMQAWRQVQKIKKAKNITGVLSFWCGECALVGSWFSKLYDITHHCWISGQDAKKENRLVRWIRPSAGELVAMSDFLVDGFLKNHGVKPSHVIPMGIDKNLYNSDAVEKDIDVLGVGSLIPLKQYDVFLHVIYQLKKQLPAIKVVICGKGPEEKKLRASIHQLDLSNNVELIGEKAHKDVLQLMQKAKVFLHPSSYEGFGGVCIEALYAGAQVISFSKPMKAPIPHWQTVYSTEEMSNLTLSILQNSQTDFEPVLAFSMEDSVKAMMKLFDYKL